MSQYLLDTNVIIEILRGSEEARRLLADLTDAGHQLCSCPVIVAEVLGGMRRGEEGVTQKLLGGLVNLPIGLAEGEKAGGYLRQFRERGVTLSVPDALIAAVCGVAEATLVTANQKDFPMRDFRIVASD